MARKQQRTKQKPFDIHAWIEMDDARKAGDMAKAIRIRNTQVEQNRPYAVKVAAQFQKSFARTSDLQDCIQAAVEGLIRAVWKFNPRASKTYKIEDFDPAKGAFTGYASRLILAELRKWSRRDKVLFKPLHEDVTKRFKDDYVAFVAKHEREPTAEEIGPLPKGMTIARIARAVQPNPGLDSLDAPVAHSGGSLHNKETTLHDTLAATQLSPEDEMIRREDEFAEMLRLAELPRDEYLAVVGYVIEERPYTEVGKRIGLTMVETRDAVRRGLEKIKARLEAGN